MESRAEIYRILSECYKEPYIEFATDVSEGHLYQELSKHFSGLGIVCAVDGLNVFGGSEEVLEALKEQYYPLFIGPFPPFVQPVESVHKTWAREETTPLISTGVKGMLMGDPAIDMLRRYEALGIEIPKAFKDTPDHLALLLEYMALLCEHGTDGEQRRFLRDHLDWMPELRRLVHACSESRFYRTVAEATAAWVSREQEAGYKGEEFHDPVDQAVRRP